jgi:hypothetical protein
MLEMANIDKRNVDALARFTESKAKLLGEIEKSLDTIKLNGSRESTLKVNMELQIKDVQESKTKLETELAERVGVAKKEAAAAAKEEKAAAKKSAAKK